MEMYHGVEKTIEKIEDGTKFSRRILDNGNCAEILSLKKTIARQLLSLINNSPKPDVDVRIEFLTDSQKFEDAMTDTFGSFAKKSTVTMKKILIGC